MDKNHLSIPFFFLGGFLGGVSGFVTFLWLLKVRSSAVESHYLWEILGVAVFSVFSACCGGMLGLTIARIRHDLASGGSSSPYLKVAVKYVAVALFVLAVNGNFDPWDLALMSCLSAITAVVMFTLLRTKCRTATATS